MQGAGQSLGISMLCNVVTQKESIVLSLIDHLSGLPSYNTILVSFVRNCNCYINKYSV